MRKLIIGVACLIGLLVLVDFVSAAYAEYRVSRALRVGADLNADPEVTFHGFPFLMQVADGEFRNIEIRAWERRPDIQGLVFAGATLRDVRMPLPRLIDGSVRTVRVGEVDGQLRLDATKLGQLLGIPDLQVSSPPADKSDGTGGSGGSGMTTTGAIVLSGTLPGITPLDNTIPLGNSPLSQVGPDGGQPGARVSVEAELQLDGNRLRIVATDLYRNSAGAPDTPVPDQDRPLALNMFTRVIDFGQLPFRMPATKVTAQGGQVVIEGVGKDMTISLDQLQKS